MSRFFLALVSFLMGSIPFCGPAIPEECESFVTLPVARQVEVFRTFPVEKQLRIYTCDYRHNHPANPGLASALAEHGESMVPFLLERLKQEKDERNQEPIIHVFELMYKRGYLRNREDVVNFLRRIVSEMKRPAVKSVSQEMLRNIESQSDLPPSN